MIKLINPADDYKVALWGFSGSIPPKAPKFEHKIRRHSTRICKITTTAVLDKDENFAAVWMTHKTLQTL